MAFTGSSFITEINYIKWHLYNSACSVLEELCLNACCNPEKNFITASNLYKQICDHEEEGSDNCLTDDQAELIVEEINRLLHMPNPFNY